MSTPFVRPARFLWPWRRGPWIEAAATASRRLSWEPDLNRDAMFLLGILVGLAQGLGWFAAPVDGFGYWQTGTATALYPQVWSQVDTGNLLYPPPVAQLSAFLQPIGWPAFILMLTAATFAAFWYCARQWSLPLILIGIPWFLGIGPEEPAKFLGYALIGNLQWILAALTILALRHPAFWAIELITKVTTAFGWWWHVLRGEWRAAAIGALATAIVVAVSFVLAPQSWIDYVGFAARNFTAANSPIPTFPIPLWREARDGRAGPRLGRTDEPSVDGSGRLRMVARWHVQLRLPPVLGRRLAGLVARPARP